MGVIAVTGHGNSCHNPVTVGHTDRLFLAPSQIYLMTLSM
jgi:hypothetical protein